MQTIGNIKKVIKQHKKELREKYKIKEIGIFGSFARNEQRKKSDIDILVDFEDDAKLSLLDVVGIEIELSELLGHKVDLVEKKNLKPYIGQHILKEVVYL